jgi:hypothetical protein
MKNSIATIIIGIALVVLGSAFTYHVFTTEIDKPVQQEAPAEAPADSSWLWTDFSHPDTLFYRKFDYELYGNEVIIYTYHPNGIMAMGDLNSPDCDDSKCVKRHFVKRRGFWNENGKFVAAYDFREKHWKCLKSDIPETFTQALYQAYDDNKWKFAIYTGLPTKNPSACPEPPAKTYIYNHNVKD